MAQELTPLQREMLRPSRRVAENIRRRRLAIGLTQEEVGRWVGKRLGTEPWSKATWSTVEGAGGRLRRLDPDELAATAATLFTTVGALFDEEPSPEALFIGRLREFADRLEAGR